MSSIESDRNESDEIGIYIREWRESFGWTQRQLADRMQVSESQISRYENNERSIDLVWILKFANAFGIPYHSLLRSPPPMLKDLIKRTRDMMGEESVSALIQALAWMAKSAV